MPKITKGGVSDEITAPGYIAPPGLIPQDAQAAGVPDAGTPDEEPSPENTSVSAPDEAGKGGKAEVSATAEAEVVKPKKVTAPRKSNR